MKLSSDPNDRKFFNMGGPTKRRTNYGDSIEYAATY